MTMTICTVAGCTSKADGSRLVCGNHRRRMRLYGDYNFTKNRKSGEGFYANGYKVFQIYGIKKFEHVIVAEKAIGKHLPIGSVVHHVNGLRDDNRNSNLVICQDRAYHNLIHARLNALNAAGDPAKRKCKYCKLYDSLSNLKINGTGFYHSICVNKYQKEKRGLL